jgi:hypothetical protein
MNELKDADYRLNTNHNSPLRRSQPDKNYFYKPYNKRSPEKLHYNGDAQASIYKAT